MIGKTNKQQEITTIYILAQEPEVAQGVIVSPTYYPRSDINYNPLILESQNQAKNIPVTLLSSLI